MNRNKKYLLLGITLLVILFGVSIYLTNKKHEEKEVDMTGYEEAEIYNNGNDIGEIIETDAELFNKLKNSDKKSLIYIGRPTCPACVTFMPTLEEVSKEYNLDFYYTNTDEWNARSVRADLYSTLKKYEGTPTVFIMYNQGEVDNLLGAHSKENLVKFLEINKIIEETE